MFKTSSHSENHFPGRWWSLDIQARLFKMRKWSNGENFISSWGPWHWFRWFVLASSLALAQKNEKSPLPHGTASSEEGEVPLPGAQLLCCVSQRNIRMQYGANIPPRGLVPQGNAAQCHVVIPAPIAQAKSVMLMWQHCMWGNKPCTFSRVMGPSASSKTREYSQWLLGKGCLSCFYTFPGRSWVSKPC